MTTDEALALLNAADAKVLPAPFNPNPPTRPMMITQATASRIWHCYREIASGETLLADMQQAAEQDGRDDHAPQLEDSFGNRRDLQLGIPSGKNSHQLFRVAPDLARSVIRAHIAAKHATLAEANEQARLELDDPPTPTNRKT